VKSESETASRDMYAALKKMSSVQNSDAKAFSAAYGEFGRAMGTNVFTFRTVLQLAGAGAKIDYLLEGTKISMYYKSWTTTSVANQWELTADPMKNSDSQNIPFEPKIHQSKNRGFMFAPGNGYGQQAGMPGVDRF